MNLNCSQKIILTLVIIFFSLLGLKLVLQGEVNQATQAEQRIKAWEHHQKMEEESIFKNLRWKTLGPKFQGGRIETIAVPSGNSTTIYLGAGAGNIWKTVNNGHTWTPIFENKSTFTIGDIDVAPLNPEIIYVGTGENLMARSSYAGMGVFKSTNGGKTWQNVGLRETHHIGRVVIHPQDPDTAYVASLGHQYTFNEQRGLFKTTDGGKNWKKVLYISPKVGVVDVAMDPSEPQTIYAAAWERHRKAWNNVECGPGSGIYKTTDGGETWEKLTEGFPQGKYVGRIGLAVAPSSPETVYAVLDNQTPLSEEKQEEKNSKVIGGEVYRSTDKGETWEKVNQSDLNAGINYSFGDIRVSPEDKNTIYVLGVNLLTSCDGGKTYEKLEGTVIHLNHHQTRALHLDQHDLEIDPSNPDRLLLGNDGGFYISNDRGKTWLHINNLPIGEFYAVDVDRSKPFYIYGGTQDNAALYGPSDQQQEPGIEDPWKQVWVDLWGGGDSYFTRVDPTNPHVVYYEQQFGDLKRKNLKTGETVSIRPQDGKDEETLRFNWMTPYIISHHNPLILYYGANKLFKSLNRGNAWRAISPDLTTQPGPEKQGDVPYGTITTISESPLRPGLIFVGTDDGNVHVSRNDGIKWTQIDEELPQKWVSRVVTSQHNLGTVYVSLTGYREDDFSSYLYKSQDGGKTWNSISHNLPQESINVIREDPIDENILYVGTDLGVYISLNQGESWSSLCNNLPTTPVHDLVIHPRERKLVIGTHGRSMFILDVKSIQELNPQIKGQTVHVFDIPPAMLPRSRDYRRDWAWETRKEAVVTYYLKQPESVDISILNEKGEVIEKLDGTQDKGFNVAVWDLVMEKEKENQVYERGVHLSPPGNYKVRIKCGDFCLEKEFLVKKYSEN